MRAKDKVGFDKRILGKKKKKDVEKKHEKRPSEQREQMWHWEQGLWAVKS